MSGILVVERSATLSHLLRRTLAAASLAPRSELASFLDTVDHLRRSHELGQPYGVAILGAPARMTREFAALLDLRIGQQQRCRVRALDRAVLRHGQERCGRIDDADRRRAGVWSARKCRSGAI